MVTELTVNLSPEKVHQHLLKYFGKRDDIRVRNSEPNLIRVRISDWRAPWMNIKIGMFEEKNGTRLTFDFSFVMTYIILAIILAGAIAFIWILPQYMFESVLFTMLISALALAGWTEDLSKAKRKFIDDIPKAFDLLNKTD